MSWSVDAKKQGGSRLSPCPVCGVMRDRDVEVRKRSGGGLSAVAQRITGAYPATPEQSGDFMVNSPED